MEVPIIAPGPDGLSFSRQTVIGAAHILTSLGHTEWDRMLLEWNLSDVRAGLGVSLGAKANSLAKYAVQNPERQTTDGERVDVAIVLRAARLIEGKSALRSIPPDEFARFRASLVREGFNFEDQETFEPGENREVRQPAEIRDKAAFADQPLSDAAITEIRSTLETIKNQLPTASVSNAARAEITADITQIEAETDRPTPRRRFMKLYLESLRDNLAKAAGAGTAGALITAAAAIAGLLVKYFGVL